MLRLDQIHLHRPLVINRTFGDFKDYQGSQKLTQQQLKLVQAMDKNYGRARVIWAMDLLGKKNLGILDFAGLSLSEKMVMNEMSTVCIEKNWADWITWEAPSIK